MQSKGNNMSNATGERTFSTKGRTVKAKTFPLVPPGNHTGIVGSDASIGKADKPDAVPYVKVSFEVNNTAAQEGGKNQRVFHMLFLSLIPGADGDANTDRNGGVVEMAQALGTELEGIAVVEKVVQDADGNDKKLEYLDPKAVVEWVKSFAGVELGFRIKTEKGTGDYADKSKISKFLLPAS
jgi:hypothetical protein